MVTSTQVVRSTTVIAPIRSCWDPDNPLYLVGGRAAEASTRVGTAGVVVCSGAAGQERVCCDLAAGSKGGSNRDSGTVGADRSPGDPARPVTSVVSACRTCCMVQRCSETRSSRCSTSGVSAPDRRGGVTPGPDDPAPWLSVGGRAAEASTRVGTAGVDVCFGAAGQESVCCDLAAGSKR